MTKGKKRLLRIGVEYRMIFVVLIFDCICEIHFGAPSRFGKGCIISLQNLHGGSFFFFEGEKTKKEANIQNLTPISTFDDLSK